MIVYIIRPKCEHLPHEVYIGSTTADKLNNRFNAHRYHYYYRKYKYRSSVLFAKYGVDNCEIVPILNCYDLLTKEELRKCERELIENTPCVNKNIPTRTAKEYLKTYQLSPEQKAKYAARTKEWVKNNPEKYMEHRKAYYERNKEKLREKSLEYYYKKKQEREQNAAL